MAVIGRSYFTCILMLAVVGVCSAQSSTPTDPYYTAGVVEFHPTDDHRDNLNAYLEIIGSVEANSTDIIVFPEATLNYNDNNYTLVPDPLRELVVPCLADPYALVYHELLVRLSCQARNVSKYVVVNLVEQEQCISGPTDPRPCAPDGLNVFNTNVVFDRKGTVVSRYRKTHLYGEQKNTTYLAEFGTFDTDFGVRFGHFICFDILFYTPTQAMVDKMGIKDFIMTTMWFSQLPFLTGVQYHVSWSYGNDINLLAAGASYPIIGTTGSGIYNGRRGALVAVMNEGYGERRIYVARVPKKTQTRQLKRSLSAPLKSVSRASKDVLLKRDYLEQYTSIPVNLTQGTSLTQDVCFGNTFCCHFELKWRHLANASENIYYTYRLGAYDGWRNEQSVEGNMIKNCALFSCTDAADILQCGKVFPAVTANVAPRVSFESILIEAVYPRSEEYSVMPNSLRDDLLPLNANSFQWNETVTNTTHHIRFQLNTTVENLLTFAIYSNYYDGYVAPEKDDDNNDDDDDDGDGGAAALKGTMVFGLSFAFMLTYLFNLLFK